MTLSGLISTAPDALRGFDCNTPLSEDAAKLFLANNYKYAIRYVPRVNRAPNDLTPEEGERILGAGLGLGVVQHVAGAPQGLDGWIPFGEKGRTYGETAAREAKAIGFPSGMTVWLDLEGVKTGTDDRDVIAYCTEWFDAVNVEFNPGIYVGWHPGLTGEQISNLPFTSYWRAYNLNHDQYPTRGFQLVQHEEQVLGGIKFDPDVASADAHGDRCWFLWPQ
jgi:hypothetical protein